MPKEKILKIMEKIKVADSKTVGKIMAGWGIWKEGNSATVNTHKALTYHAEMKNIEKCDGFWRMPDCKSEYQEHAKKLTEYLAGILKDYPDSLIYREHHIKEVGLRPDALVLKINGDKGKCLIIEVMINETAEYISQKRNTWNQWQGATEYLSRLFGYKIPNYSFVEVK